MPLVISCATNEEADSLQGNGVLEDAQVADFDVVLVIGAGTWVRHIEVCIKEVMGATGAVSALPVVQGAGANDFAPIKVYKDDDGSCV